MKVSILGLLVIATLIYTILSLLFLKVIVNQIQILIIVFFILF